MNNTVIHMSSGGSPALPRGRLIFVLDATASRRATWELARDLQAGMFRETAPIGKLTCSSCFIAVANARLEVGIERRTACAADGQD